MLRIISMTTSFPCHLALEVSQMRAVNVLMPFPIPVMIQAAII